MKITNAGEDAEQGELCSLLGDEKWYNHFGRQFGRILKI